jgi:GGDEF domain-containing protein
MAKPNGSGIIIRVSGVRVPPPALRQGLQVDRAVTASLGVASYPTDALDSDTLVRMADCALYAAKGAGRNRVELAMPSSAAADQAELSSSRAT